LPAALPHLGCGWRWRSGDFVIPGHAFSRGPGIQIRLWIPGSRGACHRAALCADPLARPGMTAFFKERSSRLSTGIKKAGPGPAVFAFARRGDRPAQAELKAPPEPSKLLLLGFRLLGLLRCLLLRFLSHSILFWVNGWKRDTEACSGRASLATASIVIPTDSRGAFARRHSGVITLSTAVLGFLAFFVA
jgi:hypothetical protein